MRIVNTVSDVRQAVAEAAGAGRTIGLVPTMGALHPGHLSLVRRGRAETGCVVMSIYVNPLQFGPGEDYRAYPRNSERDAGLARHAGVDLLFVPDDREIHVEGHRTFVEVEGLQDVLCGRSRPGHFRGVTTVVAKLLSIIRPHAAYFGEKDAQQLRIIRRMVRDLHFGCAIVGCPIVRDAEGLALSSRNAYLSEAELRAAPVLFRALQAASAAAARGERNTGTLVALVRGVIAAEPLARIDYVEAVDDETLRPVDALTGRVLLAVAAWFGKARLIDNIVLEP